MLVTSALIAACGSNGGESTQGSQRTKNGALDAPAPVPSDCVAGATGPNGGVVLGTSGTNIVEAALKAETITDSDPVASQQAAINYATNYSLNGKGGWSIPPVEVYQAVQGELFRVYGMNWYWSSTSWMPTYPILMNIYGRTDTKQSGYKTVQSLPMILTPAATAACTVIPTTTTSSTTTSTTTSTSTTSTSTTTTIAPSTTVAPSATKCTATSECAIGSSGPGGGIVVSAYEARTSESVGITYVEMAPAGWDGQQDPMFGKESDVKLKLASYRGGGFTDWRAPTENEIRQICRTPITPPYASTSSCITGFGFGGKDYGWNDNFKYWTNEKVATPYPQSKSYYFLNIATGNADRSDLTPRLRPVRAWTIQTVSLTTVPTTLPPTTTTLAPIKAWSTVTKVTCSDLSKCEVGQVGPGGGLIISADRGSSQTTYQQMAPDGWSGSVDGHDPLVTAVEAANRVAALPKTDGSEWEIPSLFTLSKICRIAAGQSPLLGDTCSSNIQIAPNFGSGVGATSREYYWSVDTNGASGRTDFKSGSYIGSATGTAYLRPVRTLRYVPPTTTTTIPLTCKAGGVCKLGDISPTGGLIVDFSAYGNQWTYTEVAPADWHESIKPKDWNGTETDPSFTRQIAQDKVNAYSGKVGRQWRLPTDREMRAAFLFFTSGLKFGPDCSATFQSWRTVSIEQQRYRFGGSSYWIAASGRPGKYDNFNFVAGAAYYDVAAGWSSNARPFAERPYLGGGNPSAASWSLPKCESQTIPTTTTTTLKVGCSGYGPCGLGEVGPNGGIIVGIRWNSKTGKPSYSEMQVHDSKYDCSGTSFGNSCVMGLYREWVTTRGYNGVFDDYPTVSELQLIAKSPTLKARLRLLGGSYFSSEFYASKNLTYDINADSTGDLLRSLGFAKTIRAKVVNMSNGSTGDSEFGYFRGVNIWECKYSCS